MATDLPPLVRPMPRRSFNLADSPASSSNSRPESPRDQPSGSGHGLGLGASSSASGHGQNQGHGREVESDASDSGTFARTRSILNLTSSTLFGIYSPSTFSADRDDSGNVTPAGTRPVTPSGSRTYMNGLGIDQMTSSNTKRPIRHEDAAASSSASRNAVVTHTSSPRQRKWYQVIGRLGVIAVLGAAYGELVCYLHNADALMSSDLSPLRYMLCAATAAVAFAVLLPWLDARWVGDDEDDRVRHSSVTKGRDNKSKRTKRWTAPEWIDVVRLIGAFVGITFAIRKIPWQSSLQRSATIALANPAVWYIVDRTLPGLVLATTVAISGTGMLLSAGPDLSFGSDSHIRRLNEHVRRRADFSSYLPSQQAWIARPRTEPLDGHESWAVAIWTASVLFVMCICFGNLGRRT